MDGDGRVVWWAESEGGAEMIQIIGGGLAGLSLGVYLRKMGIPTRLYEARSYPRHKVCGEFICGVEEGILREMGVETIIEDSLHHTEMGWWIGEQNIMNGEMPAVAWGLSRYALDEDLAGTFQKLGGELVLGEKKMVAPNEEGVVVGVGKNKAAGSGEWIGLKMHLVDVPAGWLKGLEMHVGTAGYVGLCEVEGARVNVCGLFKMDKKVKGKGRDLLLAYLRKNGLERLLERLTEREVDTSSFSATAGFQLGVQSPQGGFLLGDATYLIPPFTGNGMSMALESAYLAGNRIREYSEGGISWDSCQSLYAQDCEQRFRKRMKMALSLHPLLFHKMGRGLLRVSAQCGILPINFLFNQLRT